MITEITQKLIKIADTLDKNGQYNLADKITGLMTKLSQVDPNDPNLRQLYPSSVIKDPKTFGKNPAMPFSNPATWKQYMTKRTPVNLDAYKNLQGTEFYKKLPYYLSDQYRQDTIREQTYSPERQNNMAEDTGNPFDFYNMQNPMDIMNPQNGGNNKPQQPQTIYTDESGQVAGGSMFNDAFIQKLNRK